MLWVKIAEYFLHLLAGLLGFLGGTEAVPKLPSLVIHRTVRPVAATE